MQTDPPPRIDAKKLSELPLDGLQRKLECTAGGLDPNDARQRLEEFGYNELAEEKVNPLLKLFSYFWGPIPWMIEVAAVLSALVRHWDDFAIILMLLVMNAIVGFWEEFQVGNAINWYGVSHVVDMSDSSHALAYSLHGASQGDADLYVMINASRQPLQFGIHEGTPGQWPGLTHRFWRC
ncbi:MAG: hypothetical protein KDA86_25675 [Planctomycetaceae bacterium]|nr:hypothetical protein [Planctomycetaceae bacterium]